MHQDNGVVLILGAGVSGRSAVSYFKNKAQKLILFDQNLNLKNLENLEIFGIPEILLINHLDQLTPEILDLINLVIASPGFDINGPVLSLLREYKENQKSDLIISSDIDYFGQYAKAPIIGITGTNGKSTVTKMVFEMIQACGKKAEIGGNFGVSPFEFLENKNSPDFYVLEISSFQMELADHLKPLVSAYLNLSPNHLDRHKTLEIYGGLKQKLLDQSKYQIISHDLIISSLPHSEKKGVLSFGLTQGDFYLDSENYLTYHNQKIIARKDLASPEAHNVLNALAALGIIKILGLDLVQAAKILKTYQPLPHRTNNLGIYQGVTYINDSKATTISATVQAIESFKTQGEIILLLGGEGKDQNFDLLKPSFDQPEIIHGIIFGKDKEIIFKSLGANKTTLVNNLEEAVRLAQKISKPGQVILLSPACASLDQFKNYEARGEEFEKLLLFPTTQRVCVNPQSE